MFTSYISLQGRVILGELIIFISLPGWSISQSTDPSGYTSDEHEYSIMWLF